MRRAVEPEALLDDKCRVVGERQGDDRVEQVVDDQEQDDLQQGHIGPRLALVI